MQKKSRGSEGWSKGSEGWRSVQYRGVNKHEQPYSSIIRNFDYGILFKYNFHVDVVHHVDLQLIFTLCLERCLHGILSCLLYLKECINLPILIQSRGPE